MAEGHQGNQKTNQQEYCDNLSVTIAGTTRAGTRERHITDRLELDPSKKSYNTKNQSKPEAVKNRADNRQQRTPKMAPRRCKAEGCDYEVGKDGAVPEGAAGEIEDLKLHYVTCQFLIKSKKTVKDPKLPIYISGQSFESWFQDFTQWKENVKYTDGQCISRTPTLKQRSETTL